MDQWFPTAETILKFYWFARSGKFIFISNQNSIKIRVGDASEVNVCGYKFKAGKHFKATVLSFFSSGINFVAGSVN